MKVLEKKKEKREHSETDHRTLGSHLDLFSISEEVGIGLVLWHPRGTVVRKIIRDFWEEEHLKKGYQLVCTPHLGRGELWRTSGHLRYYKQNMYTFEKDGESYVVKPMNCPFHIQIYKTRPRSYRELPIKYAEWGTVYRYERSGTLHGLMRVRGCTQDDAHIFCMEEQLEEEIPNILDLTEDVLQRFGFFKHQVYLSTRDRENQEKYMGSEREWRHAEEALADALEKKHIPYRERLGEAAFYGPKIDVCVVDASGREWQCSTIQFDFNLPKRFNLTYVGQDGKPHQVSLIHRVLLGTIERFFGILIEHCKGNLPVWLSPIQLRVLPVSNNNVELAQEVSRKLSAHGIRTEVDYADSTIGHKIRKAEVQKIPYMVICGKREARSNRISVRKHGVGNIGGLTIRELIAKIKDESKKKAHIE